MQPGTDELWLTEHGPRGGDELNRVLRRPQLRLAAGELRLPVQLRPVVTPCRPGGGTHTPNFEEPKTTWLPVSTAPSGLAFYSGDKFPEWRATSLPARWPATRCGASCSMPATSPLREEVAAVKALGKRIRAVRQGPDGWLYLLSDDGRLVRVEQ